jgi:hypothetical protein
MNNTTVSIADVMMASAALLFPLGVVFVAATIAEITERLSK